MYRWEIVNKGAMKKMGAIHTEYQRMNLEKLEQGKGNSGSKHLLSDTESLRRHQIFQEAS